VGFESRRPDTAQRAYPIDGYALSLSLSDQLGDYRSQVVQRIWFIAVPAHVGGVFAKRRTQQPLPACRGPLDPLRISVT
jgi:hypothetical protein